MATRASALLLVAGLGLALAGCHRGGMDNAGASRPGSGNPTAVVTPSAPDAPPPGGPRGSAGASDAAAASVTGNGGSTGAAQSGQGLQGGMGAGPAPGASAAASSSAPTGQDLPQGNPGTTYHSPGKS